MILLSISILLAPYNIVLSLVQRLLSQLINFVSTYMLQLQLTYQLQSMYYAILRVHLIMGCCTLKGSLQLNAFCNSDWAGSLDDWRSTSGFSVFLGNCLISWSTKKEAVVSRSITEVEYCSIAITTAELYWLRMLFQEIQIHLKVAPVLWCDNVSALALASNLMFHARNKHIEVDYHFVRDKVVNHDIIVKFIFTLDQVAGIFTKGLSSSRFVYLKSKLMVFQPPSSCGGC